MKVISLLYLALETAVSISSLDSHKTDFADRGAKVNI